MAMIQIADEYWVEESTISRLVRENGKNMLYFKGGQSMEVESFYVDSITGHDRIVKIYPMTKETWGLYNEGFKDKTNSKWYKDTIDAIALCADGTLRPLNFGGYFNGISMFMDDAPFTILTPNNETQVEDYEKELAKFYEAQKAE